MNNGQKKLAELAGKSICKFVENGGWLGASWPNYVPGMRDLSDDELDQAWDWVDAHRPDIWEISQENFERESELY